MSEGPIITGRLRMKDETGKTLKSLQGKFSSAVKTMTKLFAGIGTAAIAGMGLAIREASSFETVLTKVIAATGKTGEEAQRLKAFLSDAAQTMGPEFGRSATDAMEALEALVKAGLEGEDAVTALSGALQLATLEGLENETASNMLVQAMTMFSLKAEDATHVIDMFSAASDAGIDTAAGYATGLANVGATANAMGMDMEETMAALVQLDNTFGGAQQSGTFLNRMLLDMAAKAEKAGIELYNADGSMKGLDEIIGQVRTKLQGFGDDQEAANEWLGQFDMRAQKAIIGLANYDGSIANTQTSLEGMQSAQDKVNMVMDTFEGRMKTLKARVSGMAISLGEKLMPHAEKFFDLIEGALPTILHLIGEFANFISKVYDLAAAFMKGEWDYAFNKLEELYGNIAAKFKEWWDSIDWIEVWEGFRTFASTLWERLKRWTGSIATAFFNWFGEIDWNTVFSTLSTWMSGFWDWLYNQAAIDIQTAFTNWLETVNWVNVFKSLGEFAIRLPIWIVEQILSAGFHFGYHMAEYIDSINWGEVFSAIKDGIINTLKGAAKALLDWMPNWLKKLLGLKKIKISKPEEPPTPPPPTVEPPVTEGGGGEGPWGGTEGRRRGGLWMQRGFEGMVTRPTLFGAGEAGPEYVSIIPGGRGEAIPTIVHLHLEAPLINVEGRADEETMGVAARSVITQVTEIMKTVTVEPTSAAAETKTITTQSLIGPIRRIPKQYVPRRMGV